MKKFLILTILIFIAARCGECQIYKGQSELSVYPGISVSNTKRDGIAYGGSGYVLGLTALAYATERIGLGLDISYADNGYGGRHDIPGGWIEAGIYRVTPMFAFKGQLMPSSKFRPYIPLGLGADWVEVYGRKNGAPSENIDSAVGIAFMGGLGFEVDVAPDAFIGLEGRYVYSNFLGGGPAGLRDSNVFNILFKVGARFSADYFM